MRKLILGTTICFCGRKATKTKWGEPLCERCDKIEVARFQHEETCREKSLNTNRKYQHEYKIVREFNL